MGAVAVTVCAIPMGAVAVTAGPICPKDLESAAGLAILLNTETFQAQPELNIGSLHLRNGGLSTPRSAANWGCALSRSAVTE